MIKITCAESGTARSLQDDDAIADTVGWRLSSCVVGGGGGYPEGWHEVEREDLVHQRDKMRPPLVLAIRLLEELSDASSNPEKAGDLLKRAIELFEWLSELEKARPLRIKGEELLSASREYCYHQGRHAPGLRAAEPLGFSTLAAELRDRLPDPYVRAAARFSAPVAELRDRLRNMDARIAGLSTGGKV